MYGYVYTILLCTNRRIGRFLNLLAPSLHLIFNYDVIVAWTSYVFAIRTKASAFGPGLISLDI